MAGAQSEAHRWAAALGHPLHRGDFISCRLDTLYCFRDRFKRNHHVMHICMDEDLGIASDSDMTFPEQQIAAAQTRERRQFSERQFLQVAIGTRCRRPGVRLAQGPSSRARARSCRPTNKACQEIVRPPRQNQLVAP